LKDGVPQLSRQSLIPGGSVEISHENLFGDSESLSVSLSASDWRNPSADLGFQMSFTQPFYAPNTTRNVQVGGQLLCLHFTTEEARTRFCVLRVCGICCIILWLMQCVAVYCLAMSQTAGHVHINHTTSPIPSPT
jgi:hypothetical protein